MYSHIGTETRPELQRVGCSEEYWAMHYNVTQQYRVNEEGSGRKVLPTRKIMTVLVNGTPTNFVPAVAVKRRGLVLIVVIGRKGRVDRFLSFNVKYLGVNRIKKLKY